MKNLVIFSTLVLLLLNGAAYAIFDNYAGYNALLSSAVLVVNGLLLLGVFLSGLKDAFKASLGILFPLGAFIALVLSFFADSTAKNDGFLFGCTVILVLQTLVFAATYYASKKYKQQ